MKCRSADDSKIFYHIQAYTNQVSFRKPNWHILFIDMRILVFAARHLETCYTCWVLAADAYPETSLSVRWAAFLSLMMTLELLLEGEKVFSVIMTLWNESMQLTQPQPFGILVIAPECARVLRQGNWGRGCLLVMRSWRYTSTCSKCDGPGSELQSWQDNAIHDVKMELLEMIPLTFRDLGWKGIW